MKKYLVILAFLAFSASFLQAQTVNEKKIAGFPRLNSADVYSFRYDVKTETYFYSAYDEDQGSPYHYQERRRGPYVQRSREVLDQGEDQ